MNGESLSANYKTSWFKDLDFTLLKHIKPMMVNTTIRKLVEEKLQPEDVQIFISKFKNWLPTQSKIQNPLGIFCDKLKQYAQEGDSEVLYALSDDEIEAEKQFALDIEKRRSELELIAKAKKYQLEQENELKFKAWIESAEEEEDKIKLYPENAFAKFGSDIYLMGLKATFLEKLNG